MKSPSSTKVEKTYQITKTLHTHSWIPNEALVCIGDRGQKHGVAYGELFDLKTY